jgi:hypothetical protein
MKFTKLKSGVSAEWKAVTDKGTFFINKSTSYHLGIVNYEVSILFEDGGSKILGDRLQYLRDAKAIAEAF